MAKDKAPNHGEAFRKMQSEFKSKMKPASGLPPRAKDGKFRPRSK